MLLPLKFQIFYPQHLENILLFTYFNARGSIKIYWNVIGVFLFVLKHINFQLVENYLSMKDYAIIKFLTKLCNDEHCFPFCFCFFLSYMFCQQKAAWYPKQRTIFPLHVISMMRYLNAIIIRCHKKKCKISNTQELFRSSLFKEHIEIKIKPGWSGQ